MEPLYVILHFVVKFRRRIPLNITVFDYLIDFFMGLSKCIKGYIENRVLEMKNHTMVQKERQTPVSMGSKAPDYVLRPTYINIKTYSVSS